MKIGFNNTDINCHIPDDSTVFFEQFWFEFVPVLHRLQGGPAAQS